LNIVLDHGFFIAATRDKIGHLSQKISLYEPLHNALLVFVPAFARHRKDAARYRSPSLLIPGQMP
jgi:hypothetical protein